MGSMSALCRLQVGYERYKVNFLKLSLVTKITLVSGAAIACLAVVLISKPVAIAVTVVVLLGALTCWYIESEPAQPRNVHVAIVPKSYYTDPQVEDFKFCAQSVKNFNVPLGTELERQIRMIRGKKISHPMVSFHAERDRYKDVLPYANNLWGDGSYNASPIYLGGALHYIAAMGPMSINIDKFWNMIIHNQIKLVISLVDSKEMGRSKCFPFWEEVPGDITTKEHSRYYWREGQKVVLRTVKHNTSNHTIQQIHYQCWPDQGPPDVYLLARLVNLANQYKQLNDSPIFVHCSAGIGRTGVFIAAHHLKYLIDRGEEFVNIPEIVYKMRDQRVGMVQSTAQFNVLYKFVELVARGDINADL